MSRLLPLAVVILCLVGCSASSPTASFPTPMAVLQGVAPVTTFRYSKNDGLMPAAVLFTNTTGKPLRYVRNGGGVGLLKESLFKDGEEVKSGFTKEVLHPLKECVSDLPPNASVLHVCYISEMHGATKIRAIQTGKYELRLRYSVTKGSVWDTDCGLTVTEFEQTIPVIIE